MTACVVGASVLVASVTVPGSTAAQLLRGRLLHAPHLVDAEVGHALRRMVLRGELDARPAETGRVLAADAIGRRHPHVGVPGRRAWELREQCSFYDALYVALAEQLEVPLVTLDERLARAVGDLCDVEVPA